MGEIPDKYLEQARIVLTAPPNLVKNTIRSTNGIGKAIIGVAILKGAGFDGCTFPQHVYGRLLCELTCPLQNHPNQLGELCEPSRRYGLHKVHSRGGHAQTLLANTQLDALVDKSPAHGERAWLLLTLAIKRLLECTDRPSEQTIIFLREIGCIQPNGSIRRPPRES